MTFVGDEKIAEFPPARSDDMTFSEKKAFSVNSNEELVSNNDS